MKTRVCKCLKSQTNLSPRRVRQLMVALVDMINVAEGVTAFLLQNGVRSLTFSNHGNNSCNISFVRVESNNTVNLDPSLNILENDR